MARTRSSRIGRYGTPAAIGCKMPGKGGFRHTRNSPPTGEFRAENVENSEATWNPLANSTDLGGYRFENSAHSPLGGERGGSHWTAWRRERDSNPRYGGNPYNALAGRPLRPLGHLSGRAGDYITRVRVSFPLQFG